MQSIDIAFTRRGVVVRDYDPAEARIPAGSEGGGEWTTGGVLHSLAKMIQGDVTPEEIMNHPALRAATETALSLPLTTSHPGYGSGSYKELRRFTFDGEEVIGYRRALDLMNDQAQAYSKSHSVASDRQAFIMVGPPAAGKSTLAEQLADRLRSAIVDPDDTATHLPEYAGGMGANAVHDEASELAAEVLVNQLTLGHNVVIPKIGHNQEKIEQLVDGLSAKGYSVHMVSVELPFSEVCRRMAKRFLETGRLVNFDYLKSVDHKPEKTYEGLVHSGKLKSHAVFKHGKVHSGKGAVFETLADANERGRDLSGGAVAQVEGLGQIRRQVGARDAEWVESEHPRGQPKNAGEFVAKGGGVHVTATAAPGVEVHVPHHVHLALLGNRQGEPPAPAQLSWEAAPGRTSNTLPGFHQAPFEQRQEYQRAIEEVLTNPRNAGDVIAQGFGLDTDPTFEGPGVFEGTVNPGAQAQVLQNLDDMSEDMRKRLNATELVRGLLLHQDAVAWHKPRFLPDTVKGPYLIPALKVGEGFTPDNYVLARSDKVNAQHVDAFNQLTPEQRELFNAKSNDDQFNLDHFRYMNAEGQFMDRSTALSYAERNGLLSARGRQAVANGTQYLIAEHLKPEATNPAKQLKDEDVSVLDFDMDRTLSPDEALALSKTMHDEFQMDFYAPIPTQRGWRFRNVPEATMIDNLEFQRRAQNAVEKIESDTLPEKIYLRLAASEGYYESNDWKDNPNGEAYQGAIDALGPDVSREAASIYARLAPEIAEAEHAFGERYNWTSKGARPAGGGQARDSKEIKRGAGVAIMDPSGRMLFLRRSAQAEQHAGHWDFPGGSIEDGEEAHEAAARECDEETHYYPFGVYPDILPEVAGDDWHYTTFAHPVDQPFNPELNDEHDDHIWARADEALEHLNLRPGIRQILTGTRDVACECGGTCSKCREVFHAYGSVA